VPTPSNLRYRKALRTIDEVVYGIIERRRRERKETPEMKLHRAGTEQASGREDSGLLSYRLPS